MKIAIVSDVHFGDPGCRMLVGEGLSATYRKLRDRIRTYTGGEPLDYLVLNGDILDFSISPFHETLKKAMPFFRGLAADALARELIYIPGNHDKHIWDAVEWQTNVIRKLDEFEEPRAFRRTQPGFLDVANDKPLELPRVSRDPATKVYGDLFLKGLFQEGHELPINVVYPNLYLDVGAETWMVTHGHMLELAWVLLSELLRGYLGGKLGILELEEWNIPITALICTGVGQGGDVSKLFYEIAKEAKEGKSRTLRRALDKLLPKLDRLIEWPWYAEVIDDAMLYGLRRLATYVAEHGDDTRYDEEFFKKKSVRKRFRRLYLASAAQAEAEFGLAPPGRIIFGHTHEPIPARRPMHVEDPDVTLVNCGGWLKSGGPRGALVFFIDETGKLTSRKI